MTKARNLLRNITILGPPGSGKGFYGKPITQHLGIPLYTVSSILRQSSCPELLTALDSGNLVDCEHVCDTLRDFLQQRSGNFMLDGFPRTLLQIELMQQWPEELRVHTAFHVDVPDFVCETKMQGRRHCEVCDRGYNIGSVDHDGFDLPALLPEAADKTCREHGNECGSVSDPEWWSKRKDDSDPKIVRQRLALHREHEGPILKYYEMKKLLFAYTPKRGVHDIPDMISSFKEWLRHCPS